MPTSQKADNPSRLEGAYNFRDLGGLPLQDGGVLPMGRLFRSDTVQAITQADADYLVRELGLRTVVDLRLTEEVEGEGRGLLAQEGAVRFIHSPLRMAATEGIPADEVVQHLYAQCLAAPALPQAIEHIAMQSGRPTLFHCAAGKDRTGMVAAIVLDILGVQHDAIVADYMRSKAAMPLMVKRFLTWPRYRDHVLNTPPAVYEVEEWPVQQLLEQLQQQGGGQAWAIAHGVAPALLEHFRQVMR